jgi:hypothetical protein
MRRNRTSRPARRADAEQLAQIPNEASYSLDIFSTSTPGSRRNASCVPPFPLADFFVEAAVGGAALREAHEVEAAAGDQAEAEDRVAKNFALELADDGERSLLSLYNEVRRTRRNRRRRLIGAARPAATPDARRPHQPRRRRPGARAVQVSQ